LGRGDVLGVFQVEGAGMKRLMMEMRPQRFDHIVAAISLYRPGPMENIPEYIARMHGKKPIQYHHPALEPILGDTYGICVSGDSLILNARTGQRGRLDEVKDWTEFYIQGIDDQWRPAVGRVTHWIDSGYQPVYQIRLRNGAQIKVTADHRLLTEEGWRPASDLQIGDYVATPPALLGPAEAETLTEDRRRLRILAYLIADGSLASMASVDFVSKDPLLLGEYQRCLATFENLQSSHLLQIRDVSRIRVAKDKDSQEHYHAPNSLLAWLRELKLKHPSGHNPGGLRSHEKFVPPFVFQLHDKDIAFFLASLWDCDGHMGHKLCHYKTVSRRLADDVQTLLLRLGIRSTIYAAQYTNPGGNGSGPQTRHSYQVTVYGTSRLAELLQPFMVSAKREAICQSYDSTTIARLPFIAEVDTATSLSRRALMAQYGIDRQHFYTKRRRLERISTQVVAPLAAVLNLPITRQRLNLAWEEIIAIEPAGMEHVYDLTVEGLHNFVANNVLVHNCVYQEQIIQIASQLAGYEPGEADMIRKAVAKKKKDLMEKHRLQFTEGAMARGFSREVCEAIWGDIEFFARYGFNRAHASDYAVITCQTAFLKAHYPVEYMTALLSVERNNTEKVAQYLADARRMGINVAPPDVNLAELDFTIEGDARQATIRYGLGAIKNAGTTAIELILQERSANGRFTSLTDLCDRVDLRRVGKRALESMIKVGVFDRWGSRPQLLDGLDRILSHSGGAREAASAGQMNLFGFLGVPQTMRVELLRPPAAVPPIDPKELLQWEKELIGVYISDHPVSRALESLQSLVTAGTADLDETMNGKNVALAGVITHVRTHSTKKGDQMAFATLEDLQGSVDLVFFPRPWKEHKEKVRLDQVLLVRGKVQLGAGNNGNKEGTTILVDNVQTNATIASAADEAPPETPFVPAVNGQRNGVARPPLMKDEGRPVNDGNPPNSDEDRGAAVEGLTTEQPAAKRKSKIQNPKSNIPLPPPNFDDDWLATATRPPELDFDLADDGLPPPLKPNHNLVRDKKPGYGTAVEPAAPPPPLSLVGRRAGGEGEPDPSKIQNPKSKIVTIEVDAIGEWKETFRQSLHIALTYEGADRLSLRLPRFGLVMDFPNYPTRFCPELVSQLQALPGVLRVYCP
ncbi:MAG: LAGLIDADG family homing endonuclease, partial [Chloroflexota bacterium]